MYSVAKTFPREDRPADAAYNHLLLATRMVRKFSSLRMMAPEALAIIQRAGLTQHRDVTRHFSMLECTVVSRKIGQLPDLRASEHLLNRAHHRRFQDLLPAFPDHSIQVLAIDPPYVYGT
jgi:hypothetical protein